MPSTVSKQPVVGRPLDETDLIGRANATGKAMRLRVLPVNTGALRLYERLGFVVTGTEGDFVYMERAADAAAP